MNNNHYTNKYSTVDIAEDWKLSGPLFNVLKYIQRRGRKNNATIEEDLLKAIWYLVYELKKDKDICDDVMVTLGLPLKKEVNTCQCPECKKARLITQKQL